MANIDPEVAKEIAKSAPPATVAAWYYILHMPVEKWVSILTLIYLTLQIFALVRKEIRQRRGQ